MGVLQGRRRMHRWNAEVPYPAKNLTLPHRQPQANRMNTDIPSRQRSASAPFVLHHGPSSARERVLRALELGRRDRLLSRLGDHARSGRDPRPR